MKIKRLEIGSFGKLKNYFLDLEDGFQILYGENEDGKSTIMNFLYLMFYGNAKAKSIHGVMNIRKNYAPWDGEKMHGAVIFEFGNTEYRLEKIFGKSRATDIVNLWNNTTGEKESIDKGEDVGKMFFDMTDSAFEKSVFIGCVGAITSDGDISAKLSNLVTNGDESVSPGDVIKRLMDGKYELVSKSGRIGKLVEMEEKIDNLSNELKIAFEMDEERQNLEKQLESTSAEIQDLKTRKNRYKENVLLMQNHLEYERIHSIINQIENLDKTVKALKVPYVDTELENYEIPITRLNHIVLKKMNTYINEAISLKKETESVSKIYKEKKDSKINDFAIPVTDEEFKTGQFLKAQLDRIEKITEYVKDNVMPIETMLARVLNQKDSEEMHAFSTMNRYLFLLCVIGFAFILCGIFVNPVGYAGLLVTLTVFVVILSFQNKKRKSNVSKTAKSKLEQEYIKEQITSLENQIREKRNKIQVMDRNFVIEMDLSKYLIVKNKEYLGIREKLQNLFNEKNSENLEELQSMHLKYMIAKDKLEELRNEEQKAKKKEIEFIDKIRFFCEIKDFREACTELEKQENKMAEIQRFTEQIENKLMIFGWEKLTLEELIAMQNQLDSKLRDESGNLISKIPEEELITQENEIEKINGLLEKAEQKVNELKFGQGRIHSRIVNINEIDEKLRELKEEQSKMKEYYDVLSIASETMEEALNELTGTFGPLVNDKTSDIFCRLTNGKYKNVSVSKKFTIRVLEEGNMISHESEYLSNGTIDQVYLSLRLAIAELITQGMNNLPILLDDVFIQYDDNRMREGLQFLYEYSKRKRQILFFTCHGNIVEWCRKNNRDIGLKQI